MGNKHLNMRLQYDAVARRAKMILECIKMDLSQKIKVFYNL